MATLRRALLLGFGFGLAAATVGIWMGLMPFVMRRFGLGVALLILPFSILAASSGFLILPSLWIASALNTADNGFSYSINQSAKEALYVPTTKDEETGRGGTTSAFRLRLRLHELGLDVRTALPDQLRDAALRAGRCAPHPAVLDPGRVFRVSHSAVTLDRERQDEEDEAA